MERSTRFTLTACAETPPSANAAQVRQIAQRNKLKKIAYEKYQKRYFTLATVDILQIPETQLSGYAKNGLA